MAGASRRSSRAHSEWNVETHMPAARRRPAAPRRASRISSAALLVNVTARTSCGCGVAVADEVGDAAGDDARLAGARASEDEQRAASMCRTASRCSGFRASRKS